MNISNTALMGMEILFSEQELAANGLREKIIKQ